MIKVPLKQPLPSNKLVLDARDVVTSTGLSMSTVRRLIKAGVLPVTRIRRRLLIHRTDLEAFLRDRNRRADNASAARASG